MADDDGTAHYIGILEAVVAVLCIKSGINPTTLMPKAIEQVTKDAGMETDVSDALIESRWVNRHITPAILASQMLPDMAAKAAPRAAVTAEQIQAASEPLPALPMSERLAEYRKYQAQQKAQDPATTTLDVSVQDSEVSTPVS